MTCEARRAGLQIRQCGRVGKGHGFMALPFTCKRCGTEVLSATELDRVALKAAFRTSKMLRGGAGYMLNFLRSGDGACPICDGPVLGSSVIAPEPRPRDQCTGRIGDECMTFLQRYTTVHTRQ